MIEQPTLSIDQTGRWMMSIQEIALSHNKKKKLLKAINNDNVAFRDDNGDIVVSVEAYLTLKQSNDYAPIETIVDEDILDYDSQYFIFNWDLYSSSFNQILTTLLGDSLKR